MWSYRIYNGGGSPGGGGTDLSKIGTEVSIKSTGAIPKGGAWEGILNEGSPMALNSQQVSTNGASYFSEDLKVGFTSTSLSNGTKAYDLWFWNEDTSTYDKTTIDLTISNALTNRYTYSTDGSLIVYWYPSGKNIVFIEVDKENKTAMDYRMDMQVENITILGNKYFVVQPYELNKTTSEYLDFYEYDRDLHTLKYLNRVKLSSAIALATLPQASQISEKAWLFLNKGYKQIYRFELNDNGEFSFIYGGAPFSTSNWAYLSNDGQYISYNASNVNYLYKLNTQDLTYTLVTSVDKGNRYYEWYINGNILIEGYSSGVGTIYDISKGAIENWVVLATGEKIGPAPTNYHWNIDKWMGSDKTKIYSFSSGSDAQYLISPKTGMTTEPGKFYGIASKTLNIGDIDKSQLLFTT